MELCLRFMGRHPREAVLKNKIPRPPCMYYNNVGLIAIIDLKGYSDLASELQERYGENGAATIQSIINPSFCSMIDICKVFQGSVVKFAGDSMTVVWCDNSKSYDNRMAIKNSSDGNAGSVEDDSVMQSRTDSADAVKLLWSAVQCCLQLLGTMRKNPLQLSPGMADPWLLNRASGLNIHIGLGYGDVHHVYLGERGNRVEYIVTGTALAAAGDLLDVAGSSELAFPINCWEILSNTLNDRKYDPHRLLNPTFLLDKNCVIVRTHAVDYETLASIYNKEEDLFLVSPAIETTTSMQRKDFSMTPDTIREWTGAPPVLAQIQTQTQTKNHRRHQAVLAAEEGLLITGYRRRSDCSVQQRSLGDPESPVTPPIRISDASTLKYTSLESLGQPESRQTSTDNIGIGSNNFMDSLYTYQGRPDTDVNEMRAVAVVFVRIPSFGKMIGVKFVMLAQEVMMVVLEALRKYEGTLRQFHMDEKGATLLLLWGVEGSAHEQDCTIFALHAACEIKDRLLKTVDEFSIGMSEGVVFSGIIGNEKRSDYTVLGVAVNEAARLMCTDMARRDVLVTDGVEQKGRSVFQFSHKDTVKLKGFRSSMRVHIPVRPHHTAQTAEPNAVDTAGKQKLVLNREPELRHIESLLTSWKNGQLPVRLVLVGANGLGKSTLLWHLHHLASQYAESLICMGKGSETHKNVPFFCVKRMLEPLFHKVYDSYVKQSLFPSKTDGEQIDLPQFGQLQDEYRSRENLSEKHAYSRSGSSHCPDFLAEPKKKSLFSTLHRPPSGTQHWSMSGNDDCEKPINAELAPFSGSTETIESVGKRKGFASESISLARRRLNLFDSKDQRTKRVALVLDALEENSEDYCLLNDVMDVSFYPSESSSHLRGTNRVAAVQRVVASILKKMTTICQIPIVWIVDDAQWLDLVGYQLLLRIVEECPNMFIAVASRPVQEYSSELSDCFKALCHLSRLPKPENEHILLNDKLNQDPHGTEYTPEQGDENDKQNYSEITLSGMDLKGTEALFIQAYQTHAQNAFGDPFPLVHAVEKRLLTEIHNCTSGNPMILSLMAQAMCTQQWLQHHPYDMARLVGSIQGPIDPQRVELAVGSGEALFRNDGSSFRVDEGILKVTGPFSFNHIARLIPVDARSAIICQLDRVDPRMRHILRIASVAGPEFSVDELLAVLDMDPIPEDGSESDFLPQTTTNNTVLQPPWSDSSGPSGISQIFPQLQCDSKSSSLTHDLVYQFDLPQSEQINPLSRDCIQATSYHNDADPVSTLDYRNDQINPISTRYSMTENFGDQIKGIDEANKKLRRSEALRKMIMDLDLFGFLAPSIGEETFEGGQLHFRHYLIQRGIYQTLLPWRLQDVHQKYALYFESLIGSADLGYVLPQLNYHLDHCQHTMDPHKLAHYAEQLFELYAKTSTISEAFKAFGRMVQILDDFPTSQTAIRAVQRAQHLRQLSEMALLLHDHDLCLESTGRIGALVGINLPRSMNFKSVGMLINQAIIQIRFSLSQTEPGRQSALQDMDRWLMSKASKDKPGATNTSSMQSFSRFNMFGFAGGDPDMSDEGHRMVAQELVRAACFRVRALYVTTELPVAATTELMYMNLAELFRDMDPSLLCLRMANMGVILYVMGLRAPALAYMRKVLALQPQMEDSCERDLTVSRIAVLYGFLGKWDFTFRYSEEAVTGLHTKGHSNAFTCFEAEFVLRSALYNLGLLKDCILACDRSFAEASEIFSEWTETLVTASQRALLCWELQVADGELSYWYDVADSQNRSISSQMFARSEIDQLIPLDCQLLLSSANLLRVDVGHFMALTTKHQLNGDYSALNFNASMREMPTDDDCSSVFQRKNIIAHEFALIMDRIEFMLNTLKAMGSRQSQVLSMQLDTLYHVILTAMFEWVPALIRLGESDRSNDPLTLSSFGSQNSQKEERRASLPQQGNLRKSRSMSVLEAARHDGSGAFMVDPEVLPGLLDGHIIQDGLKRTRKFLSTLYQTAKRMAITNNPQLILRSIQALKQLTDGNPTQARVLLERILDKGRTEEQLTKWIKANICARLIAVQALESRASRFSQSVRNKLSNPAAVVTSLRRFSLPGLRPTTTLSRLSTLDQLTVNFNFARTVYGSCGALWQIEVLQRDFSSL